MTAPHPLTRPWPSGSEAQRITALPVRATQPDPGAYTRTGSAAQLRPVQAEVLGELARVGGCVGIVGVGFGKTLIAALAPRAAGVPGPRALLLVPSPLLASSFAAEVEAKGADGFEIDPPRVLTYTQLSRADGAALLREADPDLLILDEAHYVRRRQSARTRRLLTFLRARHKAGRPVKILALSGTLLAASQLDLTHLFQWALGCLSPVPVTWQVAEQWARVLDPTPPQGIPPDAFDYAAIRPVCEWAGVTDPRVAFEQRLSTAPGVVRARGASCDASLYLTPWRPALPPALSVAIERVELTWERPDGWLCLDRLEVHRTVRQLTQGFFYRWIWPNGEPDLEWLAARSEWGSALRAFTKRGGEGLDTEGLVTAAMRRHPHRFPRSLTEAWGAWCAVRDNYTPDVETVWLDDSILRAAARHPDAPLIWYAHTATADALEGLGVEVVRPGVTPTGPRRQLAVSVQSHGTGLNLQGWCNNLVLCPPPGPAQLEQLIGRTHRAGQDDDVTVALAQHAPFLRGQWRETTRRAAILATTTGQPFRIAPGNHTWIS